ncbi:MAG: hypothetical protein BLM47_11210 [Candidatus Reconcilbacillus cellulovorans]|uniref:Hydrolase n=1 Tax=Candidatus Reconcilbacillus cellulovorans TaxID=1906605 RepID=A0A2A6DY78_9BACL|nr:MAG: hypothetical protein BLM47_11210 [Candidatus Reconcilbacillus cellulovorans]
MRLPKPLPDYKAVLFDVGDTLLTAPNTASLMQSLLADYGVDLPEPAVASAFRRSYRELYLQRRCMVFRPCTPESDRAFWVGLYRDMLRRLGADGRLPERRLTALCEEMYAVFTSPEPYELFPDVVPTLERLSAEGFRLGVVSNFAATLKRILAAKGILDYFDPVVVSTEVGVEKPDPAIFALALRKLGLSAEEVFYVGDHTTNDVWAPRQVGIAAVRISRYGDCDGEGIRSLVELWRAETLREVSG